MDIPELGSHLVDLSLGNLQTLLAFLKTRFMIMLDSHALRNFPQWLARLSHTSKRVLAFKNNV